ncbi:MAG: amidohydrolase family protein [Acetobacteraceae bacterium]|nr:amidohydrolase family protein [Acetobacteraceae bacterium]
MTDARPAFDLLVEGCTLIPAGFDPPVQDAAIGIRGGRFAFVGPRRDLPPGATATERLRAEGHLAIPGLVNVHTHTVLSMVRGVAEDMGFAPAYTPGVPQGHMVTEAEAVALARLGALEAMLFGSTLINDTYVHTGLTLPAMAELGLRVFACNRIHDVDFSGVSGGRWEYDPAIGERTLAEAESLVQRWHGGADARTGVQLAAHAPDTCSTPFLRRVAEASARLGIPVQTHLAQSRVEVARIRERDDLTPAELLDEVGLLDHRLVAAHCIHLTESDIARVGRAAVRVAHIPKGNATGGTIAPTRALTEAGARLTLATDNMHADMVEAMRWALAMGRVQRGVVEAGWQPEHMLHAATEEGAAAMGLGGELGAVRPGWRADLVLLDLRRPHLVPHGDALGTVMHTAHGRDVAHVVVEGEIIVRDGRPTRADMETVCREGAAAAAALWRRARGD